MQLWKASLSEAMQERFQGFQLTKEFLKHEKEKIKRKQEQDKQPVLHFMQQIPFVPPPPPPPAQEENPKDEEEVVDIFYEADNTTPSKNKDVPQNNPIFDSLKAQLEVNASTAMQLQKLDEEQRQTLADLQFYAQEQRALTEKLMYQERMLKLVQRDISEREHLIQFVFKERLEQMGGGDGLLYSNEDTDRDFLNEVEEIHNSGGHSSEKKRRHH